MKEYNLCITCFDQIHGKVRIEPLIRQYFVNQLKSDEELHCFEIYSNIYVNNGKEGTLKFYKIDFSMKAKKDIGEKPTHAGEADERKHYSYDSRKEYYQIMTVSKHFKNKISVMQN